MKTIIATIKSPHLSSIRTGRKIYEIRKTIPQCGFPFKVLLCKSGSGGQIFAEFVCDHALIVENPSQDQLSKACLGLFNLEKYANGKALWWWHISEMIDYCSTKGQRVRNISEYGLKRAPQSWQYVTDTVEEE